MHTLMPAKTKHPGLSRNMSNSIWLLLSRGKEAHKVRQFLTHVIPGFEQPQDKHKLKTKL